MFIAPSDSTRERVDAVLAGELDIAFARLASSPDPRLAFRRLATEPLLFAVPTGHPLSSTPPEPAGIPLAALHKVQLAFYPREQNPWWYDDILHHLGKPEPCPTSPTEASTNSTSSLRSKTAVNRTGMGTVRKTVELAGLIREESDHD